MSNSKKAGKWLAGLIILVALVAFGCAGKSDLKEQVSGKWQRPGGKGTVEIQIAKDPASMVVDGKSYKAVVEKVDMDRYSVLVKVEDNTGKTDEWTLQQKWDDEGNSFNLAFDHDGSREILVSSSSS